MKSLYLRSIDKFLFSYLNLPVRFPSFLHIECTNQCNGNCVMCYREKMERPLGIMSMDVFKKIIKESARLNVKSIYLSNFGEPLLDPSIIEKIRYAKAFNLIVTISTNGSLLSQAVARDLISAGLDRLHISVHGATESTHDFVQDGISLRKVEENIQMILKLRNEINSRLPSVMLKYLLCKETAGEEALFMHKWKGLVDDIHVSLVHDWSGAFQPAGIGKLNYRLCTCPFTTMQILYNGDVVGCHNDYDGALRMGNMKTDGLRLIWNNNNYKEFRKKHIMRSFDCLKRCKACSKILHGKLRRSDSEKVSIRR